MNVRKSQQLRVEHREGFGVGRVIQPAAASLRRVTESGGGLMRFAGTTAVSQRGDRLGARFPVVRKQGFVRPLSSVLRSLASCPPSGLRNSTLRWESQKFSWPLPNGRSSIAIGNLRHLAMPRSLVSLVSAVGGGADMRLT